MHFFSFFHFQVVTCGPNEALIISGVFHGNEPTMIVGGRALVFPMVQTIQKLPLSTMTLVVQSPKVYTSQGVPISVTGVAQVSKQPAYLNIKTGAPECLKFWLGHNY